jgi:hypothetical protein
MLDDDLVMSGLRDGFDEGKTEHTEGFWDPGGGTPLEMEEHVIPSLKFLLC